MATLGWACHGIAKIPLIAKNHAMVRSAPVFIAFFPIQNYYGNWEVALPRTPPTLYNTAETRTDHEGNLQGSRRQATKPRNARGARLRAYHRSSRTALRRE